jgi:hypothetical protein
MHHPLQVAVAVAAALVAVAFALSTFERWRVRQGRHDLAWTAAMVMFAMAAGALAAGAQAGWSPALFRIFYLFGAILNVPFLALGTVYLLAGRSAGDRTAAGISLAAAFACGVMVTASLRAPLPPDQLAQGSKVFSALPRVLAAVASGGGGAVIFAGAAWSGWRVWGNRAAGYLLSSNGLIAAGTAVLAGSGTLNSVFGAMTAFAVTLLIGIVVLFCGFLLATSHQPVAASPIRPASRWNRPAAPTPPPIEREERAAAPSRRDHEGARAKI